ncbi:MAG: hypothetical protein WCT25_00860 [Candidatus Paceibacterota bacterium]|jgi:hypothetical protein
MALKIKGVGERREIFISLLIILVAFGSFGLGRLSKIYDTRPEVKVRLSDGTEAVPEADLSGKVSVKASNLAAVSVAEGSGKVVASKSGTKYHFPWCAGASQISEANKIWFDSVAAAEEAGYSKAANCKGL